MKANGSEGAAPGVNPTCIRSVPHWSVKTGQCTIRERTAPRFAPLPHLTAGMMKVQSRTFRTPVLLLALAACSESETNTTEPIGSTAPALNEVVVAGPLNASSTDTLVYLSYSDRVIEGSPDNSITAVPLPTGTVIPMR